jgi:hypothetical protein
MTTKAAWVQTAVAHGEQALWGAVLVRMVLDALWPYRLSENKGSSGVRQQDYRAARVWFARKGRDFTTVCHLAGFDPDFVHARIVPMLDAPVNERKAFLMGIHGRNAMAQHMRFAA